jgi:thiosulfate reductase cytochrome b subunit
MTASSIAKRSKVPAPRQALLAKIFHWLNIIGLLLMITSGLQIYNANPVFGGRAGWHFPAVLSLGSWHFPSPFLLGGWLAGGRNWHFAAMWLFALNLLWYGLYILISRRWERRFAGVKDLKALQVGQNSKRKAYAWHRLVYTAIVPVLLLALLSGLGMYKPAQFSWILSLFGGDWQALRIVHFLTVPTVIVFALIHSLLGLKVGGVRLLNSIFW